MYKDFLLILSKTWDIFSTKITKLIKQQTTRNYPKLTAATHNQPITTQNQLKPAETHQKTPTALIGCAGLIALSRIL